MKLARDEWSQLLDLLDTALELPETERGDWLRALPDPHSRLRPALEQLLDDRRAIETDQFLSRGPALRSADEGARPFSAGQEIGPYRLIRELGSGGMASVWLAARADGIHQRQVALKLPLLALRPRVIAERFAREREILSNLSHRNIASVLDAGSDAGQPYLVMEFVDGQAITAWCNQAQLGTRARLQLFLQVLGAVQHAHAQLVIHRDIKPSNVFVDRDGHVKLLDFGVAKLLDGGDAAAAATALTQWGGRAMTPQYASPEQISGAALGTATDIYSLGVLLYELLTGHLPYRLKRDSAAALEEAILAAQLVPPSRHGRDQAQARALRGDVDTIVLKALQATPTARYASAEAFAQDIERYLGSLPILARPASWGYRLRKTLVRHTRVFVAGAALVLALVLGLAGTLWQADRAQAQTARAEAVQRFLAQVLGGNDPQQAQGRELSARDLLDKSAARIESEFADRPDLQAQLHHTVAEIYISLGRMGDARRHLEPATVLYAKTGQVGSERHLEALFNQSEVLEELREYDAARAATETLLQVAARHLGEPHRWSGPALARLSWIAGEQGQLPRSSELAQQALDAQRRYGGERTPDYLRIAGTLAQTHLARGDLRQARALMSANFALGQDVPGYDTTDHLVDGYSLARVTFMMGDAAAAEVMLRDLLPRLDRHIGPQHDRTVVARSLFAQTLVEGGQYAEGVQVQRDNLAHVRGRTPPEEESVALQRLTLAKLLRLAGRYNEGVPLAREGLAYFESKYSAPTWYRERGRWVLGELLLGAGQREEGLRAIETALRHVAAMDGASQHHARAEMMLSLAFALRHGPRGPEAAVIAAEACSIADAAQGADSQPALRCQAAKAWIDALRVPLPERAAAATDRFVQARTAALARLAEKHALRLDLAAADGELAAAPARTPAALQLLH